MALPRATFNSLHYGMMISEFLNVRRLGRLIEYDSFLKRYVVEWPLGSFAQRPSSLPPSLLSSLRDGNQVMCFADEEWYCDRNDDSLSSSETSAAVVGSFPFSTGQSLYQRLMCGSSGGLEDDSAATEYGAPSERQRDPATSGGGGGGVELIPGQYGVVFSSTVQSQAMQKALLQCEGPISIVFQGTLTTLWFRQELPMMLPTPAQQELMQQVAKSTYDAVCNSQLPLPGAVEALSDVQEASCAAAFLEWSMRNAQVLPCAPPFGCPIEFQLVDRHPSRSRFTSRYRMVAPLGEGSSPFPMHRLAESNEEDLAHLVQQQSLRWINQYRADLDRKDTIQREMQGQKQRKREESDPLLQTIV